MSFYVIIRGPLGVGKTTVARRLAKVLQAQYLSIDRVLDDHGIWYDGRLSEFLKANAIVSRRARRALNSRTPVVLDGNFYWKTQIDDLERRLAATHVVVTLTAPLEVCIARDSRRRVTHGSEAARQVFAKTTRFAYGIDVDATGRPERTVRKILSTLSRRLRTVGRSDGALEHRGR